MGEQYRVDRGTTERTVADVRGAASDVTEQARALAEALDAFVSAAGGSDTVATAIASFAATRSTTAPRIGTHLAAVSAVGRIALAAVDEADAEMAVRAERGAVRRARR